MGATAERILQEKINRVVATAMDLFESHATWPMKYLRQTDEISYQTKLPLAQGNFSDRWGYFQEAFQALGKDGTFKKEDINKAADSIFNEALDKGFLFWAPKIEHQRYPSLTQIKEDSHKVHVWIEILSLHKELELALDKPYGVSLKECHPLIHHLDLQRMELTKKENDLPLQKEIHKIEAEQRRFFSIYVQEKNIFHSKERVAWERSYEAFEKEGKISVINLKSFVQYPELPLYVKNESPEIVLEFFKYAIDFKTRVAKISIPGIEEDITLTNESKLTEAINQAAEKILGLRHQDKKSHLETLYDKFKVTDQERSMGTQELNFTRPNTKGQNLSF